VHAEGRNKNKKYMLKEGIKTRSTKCFVLLVFIPSFSMHFLFLIRPSVYTSCFYSFLHFVLLVCIPSFSMYFLKQEVHAEGRNKNKKYMLKEGIQTRSTK
jgi:hypothetical protein